MAKLIVLLTLAAVLFGGQALAETRKHCYCNTGTDCLPNNTCFASIHMPCLVDVSTITGRIRHHCLDSFLSCVPSETGILTKCCDTNDTCNKCLVPDNLPYDICMNVSRELPPDCPPINCTAIATPPTPSTTEKLASSFSTRARNGTDVTPTPSVATPLPTDFPGYLIGITVLGIVVPSVIGVLVGIIVCVCYKRNRKSHTVDCQMNYDLNGCQSYNEEETDYGLSISSSGVANSRGRALERRTVADDVVKQSRIARGGYGEVWQGTYRGDPVAIKVFSRDSEASCKIEYEIYTSKMLNHESIVRFIAVDRKFEGNQSVKLWLIMEYYPCGCLGDYLMEHSVKPGHVHRMLFSIASALDFLHVPVSTNYDQSCKPGIAHRDLKTRNILLKRDGSCVLADFGLAVRTQDFETTKPAIKSLVGTKRYMAPEVLSGDISTRELTPFCKADIYSFGLVMWEVLRRAETDGKFSEYQLPYQNSMGSDPTVEDVSQVVVERGERPLMEERWMYDECLSAVSSLMKESWTARPDGRPSARWIKKKLLSISQETKTGYGIDSLY